MIDLKQYRLTYYRKSDGRAFPCKRVTPSDYVIFDTELRQKIFLTIGALRKSYFTKESKTRGSEIRICKKIIA
jgi:hypothetical protein